MPDPVIIKPTLHPPAAWLTLEDALRLITPVRTIFPPPLEDETLSGARMNAGGAYLELNVPTFVNGNDGVISFMGSGRPCGGEVYVRMPGVRPDMTYLGQLRCVGEPMGPEAAIGVNVFGGGQGTLSSEVRVFPGKAMVVPFVLAHPAGPTPTFDNEKAPLAAFHPINLRNWFVQDVRVQRVAV